MAAFSFPQSPTNGQTVTNAATGLTYVFRSTPAPGKWEVQMADNQADFVNVTGDTMTGPLILNPATVLTSTDAVIKIDNSSGNANAGALLEIDGSSSTNIFNLYNNAFSSHLQFFQIFTPGPTISGGVTGFSLHGKNVSRPGDLNETLLQQIRDSNSQTADSLRYDGLVVDDKDIVNKAYVDTTALTSGGTIIATGGSVDTSGNLTIKQSVTDAHDGRLYLKHSDNTTNISLYGASGGIDMKGNLSFNSTSNNKNIRAYGSSSPVIKFLTGADASNLTEQMSISSSGLSVVNTITTAAATPIDFTLAGTQTININKAGSLKFQTFINGGGNDGNPTDSAPLEIITAYNTIPTLRVGPAINFNAQSTTTITNGGYTVNYLLNSKGLYFYKAASNNSSDLMFTLNGDQNSTSYGIKAWDTFTTVGTTAALNSQVTIEAPLGSSVPGLAIKTTNNNTTLWNATQPGHLRFQTTSGNNGGTCGIQVQGDSSSPSFMMTIGAPGYSLDRVFSCSYSSTYGKRIYVYPDWGSSYSNAVNLPDQTPVTLGYLRANGLVTIASTTSTQEADDPSGTEHGIISAQTAVTVPSQMTLSADTDGGQGFTLKGKTIADPTSHNGDVLKTTHSASNTSAELEYFGSTAGTNSVQTKESVAAAITAAAPEAPSWSFFNQNDSNTGSTLDGFWTVQYDYTAVEGRVIVKAKNDTANIANGTVVVTMPAASRPKSMAVIRLTSRDGLTTADGIFSNQDGNITVQNVQGTGDPRLEGMLIYPIHDA